MADQLQYMPKIDLQRRQVLALGLAALHSPVFAQSQRQGRILIVGGAEDRLRDKVILKRFYDICGGELAHILVLTAASADPAASWASYEQVFSELGSRNTSHLVIGSTEDANDATVVNRLLNADGIFMSGGDQRRLMERLWETNAARAMHTAYHLRGACIGGTSAGAAALSRVMIAEGFTPPLPEKDAVTLDIGLGFMANAIIDQHFSERRRLGRLMSTLAQRPDMLGVGIDENTALLVERHRAVEVIGQGAVTLIDGRRMRSNFDDAGSRQRLEMLGVTMHVLPAGNRYEAKPAPRVPPRSLPASLREAIAILVEPGPIRGL